MARRRRREAIELSFFGAAAFRVGGAIVLDTLAFSVWNIGTRSPAHLIRDLRARVPTRDDAFVTILRGLIGVVLLAAATVLLVPAIAELAADFLPSELFTLLVALALEHLVGPDVRLLWHR